MSHFRTLIFSATVGAFLIASSDATLASAQAAPSTQGEGVPALAAHLKAEVVKAEAAAIAAFFPRRNVLAAVSKSMWTVFYEGRYTADQQSEAIALVAAETDLSPLAREAVERMKVELTLD